MAVPILDHMGYSVAAISISFPVFRFDPHRKPDYVELLLGAGAEASSALGYSGTYPARLSQKPDTTDEVLA
jgi:IclR family KDG regulon transcriptional repressor